MEMNQWEGVGWKRIKRWFTKLSNMFTFQPNQFFFVLNDVILNVKEIQDPDSFNIKFVIKMSLVDNKALKIHP